VVDRGAALADAIAARVDAMLAAGWLAETRRLADEVPAGAAAWSATGYEALRRVVTGESTLAAARDEIVAATRRYARRQRTWFRHQLPGAGVTRLDAGAPDALDRLRTWWTGEI
jgi:tRNA dimethylallyltransferase